MGKHIAFFYQKYKRDLFINSFAEFFGEVIYL